MRALLLTAVVAGVMACAPGTSTLELTLTASPSLGAVDHVTLGFVDVKKQRTAQQVTIDLHGNSLPPDQKLAFYFGKDVDGQVNVIAEAFAATGEQLANVRGQIAMAPSKTVTLTLAFVGNDQVPPDFSGQDFFRPDLGIEAPAKPTGLTVTSTAAGFDFTWDPVVGATSYQIQYADQAYPTFFNNLDATSSTSSSAPLTASSSGCHSFSVQVVATNAGGSSNSDPVMAKWSPSKLACWTEKHPYRDSLTAIGVSGSKTFASGYSSLIGSTDDGASWTTYKSPSSSMLGMAVTSSHVVVTGSVLTQSTSSWLFTSADGGTTFTDVTPSVGFVYGTQLFGSGDIVVATAPTSFSDNTRLTFRSTDGGATFAQVTPNLVVTILQGGPHGFIGTVDANTVAVSTDGVNWTSKNFPSYTYPKPFQSDTTFYVIMNVPSTNGHVLSSATGAVWTDDALVTGGIGFLSSIAVRNGVFVGVGGQGIQYSTDTKTWTSATSPTAGYLYGIAATASGLVAVGDAGGIVRGTVDGQTWTMVSKESSNITSIAPGVASALVAGGDSGEIFTSYNAGSTWLEFRLPIAEHVMGVYGAYAVTPTRVYTNNGGSSWTERFKDMAAAYTSIANCGTTWVAAGNNAEVAYSNDDGASFTIASLPSTPKQVLGVACKANKFVISGLNVSSGPLIYTSTTGAAWTVATLPGTAEAGPIAYGNGQFVIANKLGSMVSPDGDTWTQHAAVGISGDFNVLGFGSDVFVVAETGTTNAAFASSADGFTWTEHFSDVSVFYAGGVGYAGGAFWAGGSGGKIISRVYP